EPGAGCHALSSEVRPRALFIPTYASHRQCEGERDAAQRDDPPHAHHFVSDFGAGVCGPGCVGPGVSLIIWFIICVHPCIIRFMSPIMGIIPPIMSGAIVPDPGCRSCWEGAEGCAQATAPIAKTSSAPTIVATCFNPRSDMSAPSSLCRSGPRMPVTDQRAG